MSLPMPIIPPPETPTNPFKGLVSVIIPTFNCAATLPRSIASLKAQTYKNIEIIVSDDASTDNTAEVVKGLDVIYLRSEVNGGAAVSRNDGVKASKGELLFFAEADGYYESDYIEKIIRYLHLPQAIGSINLGRKVWTDRDSALVRHQNDLHEAAVRQVLAGKRGTGAFAFRRDAFEKVGGYDPGCRVGQDVDLVRRLIQAGGRTIIGDRSIIYHKDPDNIKTYLKRAHRGAFNTGVFMSRWKGMRGAAWKLSYLGKFSALMLLPVYFLLTILMYFVFFIPFVAGIAYLLLEDPTTRVALGIALERKDYATVLLTPVFLYLRRAAIGVGRIRSFFR